MGCFIVKFCVGGVFVVVFGIVVVVVVCVVCLVVLFVLCCRVLIRFVELLRLSWVGVWWLVCDVCCCVVLCVYMCCCAWC